MNRESARIIESLEASPHLDPWSVIKDLYGWDYLIGWAKDGSTDLKEVLLLLNKQKEDIL